MPRFSPTFSKVLASGQLAADPTAIYTTPQMLMTRVHTIRCLNTGGGANTVTLAVQPSGGTARNVTVVSLAAGYMLIDTARLDLQTGDAILGSATNADQVNYVISGEEEDRAR